jgi:hypothetical protein
MSGIWKLVVPSVGLHSRFYNFFVASGRNMFPKDFGMNRYFLGRRWGVSPWLIAIFEEHVEPPQSILQGLW